MKSNVLISAIALCFVTGCAKHEAMGGAKSEPASYPTTPSSSSYLHPAPGVVVTISQSEYEETVTIPADWNGVEYCNYTFNCPSASIERVIKFLHWTFELSSPSVTGAENLPTGLYFISFGDKKWDSKEDVVKDVMHAVEITFDLEITLQESPRTLIVKKKNE